MENEIMIEIHDLVKTYKIYDKPIDRLKESLSLTHKQYSREFHALNGVNLTVKKGENIGIIGTNGAGKSTLLKIITGVLSPTSGSVTVNGKISALLELGAGFNPEYTGLENIYLNGTMMGYTREEVDVKVEGILQFADIGDFIYQPVKTYSSGMFARLAFAVAINVEPEILIVDEALSVGDVRFQMKCMNKMKELMEGGTSVLFVSHDINVIRRFCTKAVWLNKGKVEHYGEVNLVADIYLEYLKTGVYNIDLFVEKEKKKLNLPLFMNKDAIAEIISFKIYDEETLTGIDKVEFNKPLLVEVIYDVYDESVENPVLGIAIRRIDDEYICGLNTLLDNYEIPWRYGRNKMYLSYHSGILTLGGSYYFDVALMDQTASVNIHYLRKVLIFQVDAQYKCEGSYLIPHRWRGEK